MSEMNVALIEKLRDGHAKRAKSLAESLKAARDMARELTMAFEKGRAKLSETLDVADRLAAAERRAFNWTKKSDKYREHVRKRMLKRAAEVRKRGVETANKIGTAGSTAMRHGTHLRQPVGSILTSRVSLERAAGELATLGRMSEAGIQKFIDRGLVLQKKIAVPDLAAKFIEAAYNLRSDIRSLDEKGLAETATAAVFAARATNAELENFTGLFAIGHRRFKDKFKQLSDGEFAARLAAQLAMATQQFKIPGSQMQMAIESAGNTPSQMGMGMSEQFAALGMLRRDMEATDAGTALKSLAEHAVTAHEAFAKLAKGKNKFLIEIVDSDGRMRPLADILQDFTGRYGEINALDRVEIKKAFGSGQAAKLIAELIASLQGRHKALRSNMVSQEMAGNEGLPFAKRRAKIRENGIDAQFQRIANNMDVFKKRMGKAMEPEIKTVTSLLENFLDKIAAFVEGNNTAARVLGYLAVGAVVFGPLLMGIGKIILGFVALRYLATTLGIRFITAKGTAKGLFQVFRGAKSIFMAFGRAAVAWIWRPLAFLASLAIAHPIAALIAGIAVGALWIYSNWSDFGPFFENIWDNVKAGFSSFKDWLTDFFNSLPDLIDKGLGKINAFIEKTPLVGPMYQGLKGLFGYGEEGTNWLPDGLPDLPSFFGNSIKPKLQNFQPGPLSGTMGAQPLGARRSPTDLMAMRDGTVDQSTRVNMSQSNTINIQVSTGAGPNEIARKVASAISRATTSALHDGVPA